MDESPRHLLGGEKNFILFTVRGFLAPPPENLAVVHAGRRGAPSFSARDRCHQFRSQFNVSIRRFFEKGLDGGLKRCFVEAVAGGMRECHRFVKRCGWILNPFGAKLVLLLRRE